MNILIVQTGFLGDVVLSTPVISKVRELYPEASISFLTTPIAKDVVAYNPEISKTLIFDKREKRRGLKGLLEMAAELRSHSFTHVFCLHKSWRTVALIKLARIPVSYGFKEASGSFLYTKTARRKDLNHEVERNLAILRTVGVDPETSNLPLVLHIPEQVTKRVMSFLEDSQARPLVGIAPGSVWATKRWTEEGFAMVVRKLAEQGYRIFLIGGKEDKEIAQRIASKAPVMNLVGNTSVIESIALIDLLDVFITNDSAPLHFASACQTPTVALFCATIPEFGFGPWKNRAEVLGVTGLECRPCGRHGGHICPTGTNACQKNLKPEWVIEAVNRLSGHEVVTAR